jgi:squalene cyclase
MSKRAIVTRSEVATLARGGLRHRAQRAIDKAIAFLIRAQEPSGIWLDYAFPIGPSDEWVTSYVGFCLAEAAPDDRRVSNAIAKAAEWLVADLRTRHGAGYNWLCPADSDSTGWAVLFLRASGHKVEERLYELLLQRQNPDGGFATYDSDLLQPGHSWASSHPEVTPVALRALLTRFDDRNPAVCAGFDYVIKRARVNDLWPSFWWTNPVYSTCMNVTLLADAHLSRELQSTGRAVDALPECSDPFSIALLAEIGLSIDGQNGGAQLERRLRALCELQARDGSWPSSAILRLTHSDCPQPWRRDGDVGDLYPDVNRLITSSTVLRSLARGIRFLP